MQNKSGRPMPSAWLSVSQLVAWRCRDPSGVHFWIAADLILEQQAACDHRDRATGRLQLPQTGQVIEAREVKRVHCDRTTGRVANQAVVRQREVACAAITHGHAAWDE